jgi:integrase
VLAFAWQVDPRFEFLMVLGAELRLGQVLRCRRPDLDLEHKTLTVPGRGGKKGVVSKLTEGQMAVVTRVLGNGGYLSKLERAAADYALFPGIWRGKDVAHERYADVAPLGRDVIDRWFHRAEELAGVPLIPGRGAYGVRRAAVDAAKSMKISREGLQQQGGWADTQMPDQVYADQEADYARDEARDVRAKIRGEE